MPTWQAVKTIRASQAILAWLSERGSLTQRLRETYPDDFQFKLIAEKTESDTTIREVTLGNTADVFVYGRTAMPKNLNIGHRPLGDVLFAEHSHFHRGEIEACEVSGDDDLFQAAKAYLYGHRFWARRSTFSNGEQSLTVVEVFQFR